MQDDMVNLKRFDKTEEDIYSDFFNYSKTFIQIPIDETVRVGFNQRQVESFQEWEVGFTVINENGLTVIMKLQNETYFPIIVKMLYLEGNDVPYSVEQIV